MARNIEVLRNYFLGKDPQLKETMADNSLRLIGIPGKHFVLRTELLRRLNALQDELEDADEDLLTRINTVDGRVTLERSERIQHDNTIMGKVNDNVTAIMNLGNALSLERDARQAADGLINGKIDDIQGWIANTDFVLDEDLAAALENYYTKAQVNQLISVIPKFDIEVVQTLPVQDISDTTIYLVPSQDPQTANSYDEFIHVNNSWEQIGSTAVDLSNYYTKSEADALLDDKQDTLTAGTNIDITNDTISTIGDTIKDMGNTATLKNLAAGVYRIESGNTLKYVDTVAPPPGGGTIIKTRQFTQDAIMVVTKDGTTTYCEILLGTPTGSAILYGYMESSGDGDLKDLYLGDIKTDDFTGTDGTADGTNGLVPAPTTTDNGKFLSADGTWQEAGGATITYGTTDLTPGVSPLAEGTFYFQYE